MAAAAAMFYQLPSAAEAAAAGFEVSDYEPTEPADVWPDNWPVFKLFERVSSQWRMGPGGPVALDFNAVYPLLDRMAPPLSPADWLDALDDVRDMQEAALKSMRPQA